LTRNAPQLLEDEAALAFFTLVPDPLVAEEGQTAPASQAQVGAQAGTQAGAEIRPQTQAEAQAQGAGVHSQCPAPPTAQPSTVAGPLPIYGAPPASHLNLPSQLTPDQQTGRPSRASARDFAALAELTDGSIHLQHPYDALSASLPYASVPAPL
jgi:hypothetical protein